MPRVQTTDSADRPIEIEVTEAGKEVTCGHKCWTINSLVCARQAGHPGDHMSDQKYGNIVWGNRPPQ